MLEPWNNAAILPPPVHTVLSSKNKNCTTRGDITRITQACTIMKNILSKQAPLHQEGALISRFLYKFDMKFRSDIGYRQLKKVNTAVRKYLSLNIYKDIEQFASVLPSRTDELYLPTKQMLEYVLVRLITFAKLMKRICVCSKQGGVFYLNRVKRGESHWMSLMPYALLCRMWSISTVLLQHACQWYSQLFSFLGMLEAKGLPFLPTNYELPSNLAEWLDICNIDSFGRFQWSQKLQPVLDASLLIDEDSNAIENVILQYVNQINEDVENQQMELLDSNMNSDHKSVLELKHSINNTSHEMFSSSLTNIDKGKVVSRDSFIISNSSITSSHTADKINSIKDLKAFLDKEEQMRNNGYEQSLTKHLSFMQWVTLKNSLTKLLTSVERKTIKKKFQKIWKEKCVNYI